MSPWELYGGLPPVTSMMVLPLCVYSIFQLKHKGLKVFLMSCVSNLHFLIGIYIFYFCIKRSVWTDAYKIILKAKLYIPSTIKIFIYNRLIYLANFDTKKYIFKPKLLSNFLMHVQSFYPTKFQVLPWRPNLPPPPKKWINKINLKL